ncbi:MAG: hypothetical protein M3R70_00765 [Actinomycetota bacterium]|nr:hypothetical protein [Actinomycetota bacterium]
MGYRKTFRVGRRKREVALAACLVGLFVPVGAASATKKPPPGAVDAYRESVPTADGSRGVGDGSGRGLPLSPKAQKGLRNSPTLKRIATSPKLGAPSKRLHPVGEQDASAASLGRGIKAATGALGSGNTHMLALLAALGATAAGCVWWAARRRRSTPA